MGLEDLFFQNTDMVLYLFLVQSLSVLAFYSVEQKIDVICRYVLASQIVLIGLFYCVWGGYGVDSRDYLTGFDGSPFVFGKEYLFWMVGYKLNKLFVDPWPLKLLSTLSVIILCLAILIYFKEKKSSTELSHCMYCCWCRHSIFYLAMRFAKGWLGHW